MIDSILRNSKILVVDDKESNVDILQDLLEESGYKNILSTTDSRRVLGLFKSFNPDLILLDLMMPYLSGFEVMNQLKEVISSNTYLPILVLTSDITPETKLRALSGGAKDFLSKPLDLFEVKHRIKNLLETKYLYHQLEKQNQILEEKVKERTQDLELINLELILARDKAQESNRLKTAFLNNISHEIRTPLNGILGSATFIIKPNIRHDDKEVFLKYLNSSSDRLINTITDIMDMSLIVSDSMEVHARTLDPAAIIHTLYNEFITHFSEKKLDFKIKLSSNDQHVVFKSDDELLVKALSHIVNNSLKFTSSGGITVGYHLNDDRLIFQIEDTGIGIEKNAQQRILDIFVQEDYSDTRNYEGSGLGLSIAAGLVRLLGGNIRLESEKNQGTAVFISLPVEKSTSKRASDLIQNNDEFPKLSIVLIAEDDDSNYSFLKAIIKKIAVRFERAKTGVEAVEICHKTPGIDLVLMDIRMPELNGIEATKKIRRFNKDVVIIAQTAYGLTGDRERAIEAGCNDYISKPFIESDLLALIQNNTKI